MSASARGVLMIDLLWLLISILLIVGLIMKVKLHPAISLVIGSLLLGALVGMP
ncbi:MAG: hypothetical protein ACK5KO_06875, partial [Arachnia sp.]